MLHYVISVSDTFVHSYLDRWWLTVVSLSSFIENKNIIA